MGIDSYLSTCVGTQSPKYLEMAQGYISLSPRLGDVEAPPKPRSSLSSVAEVESEPLVRAKRSSSSSGVEPESEPWVGRSGVRRLPGLNPSPSPGSGGVEFAVFWGLARVRALGRAERSSPSSGA
jgi:hypothetical protein